MRTLAEIKKALALEGYFLVAGEYRNNKSLLSVRCPEGHEFSTCWNYFQQGNRCAECAHNKRKTVEEFRVRLEKEGYQLLGSAPVINSTTKLEVMCPSGHRYLSSWGLFCGNSRRCSVCSGKKKKTLSEVRGLVHSVGYELLSAEYVNATTPLLVRCERGHLSEMSFANLRYGYRCLECSGRKKRDIRQLEAIFKEAGYALLQEGYTNSATPLQLRCPEGHDIRMSWDSFRSGARCVLCSNSSPVSKVSQEWLDSLGISQENREVWITCGDKKYRVDAYVSETNTIYEFLGDYWHGNPARFLAAGRNVRVGKSFGELYCDSLNRLNLFKDMGYRVVSIWESDYRKCLEVTDGS